MFGSHNESFDEKRQLLEARDLESNAIETNASDNNKPAAATTTTTMFARVGKTTKFVAIGALCVGSALAVSTGSSSASQKHLFRMGETAGTADGVTDDLSEQLVGNGTTYRGKQTKSITGKDCKSWVQTTITPDDHPMDGLLENYCRNPGGVQESIFCFVGGGETEACEPLGYDSKAVLTKDQEEVERLERELVQAQEEMQPNPQEPQVGEIIVTEEVPVTNGPTADEMDDTIGSREPMHFQSDADGSFAETGEVVQPQSPDDERVGGNGQAYRGKQAKSRSGLECKKWV